MTDVLSLIINTEEYVFTHLEGTLFAISDLKGKENGKPVNINLSRRDSDVNFFQRVIW